jgi:hypothetical protein
VSLQALGSCICDSVSVVCIHSSISVDESLPLARTSGRPFPKPLPKPLSLGHSPATCPHDALAGLQSSDFFTGRFRRTTIQRFHPQSALAGPQLSDFSTKRSRWTTVQRFAGRPRPTSRSCWTTVQRFVGRLRPTSRSRWTTVQRFVGRLRPAARILPAGSDPRSPLPARRCAVTAPADSLSVSDPSPSPSRPTPGRNTGR